MMEQQPQLNEHNKQEYPPMHTAEFDFSSIVVYETENHSLQLEVRVETESVWLNLNQIASLFERDKSVISRHIHKIFAEGELDKDVVVAKKATTTKHGAIEGKKQVHEVDYYNLDVIISVGYRVKSVRGTRFRIWANKILKDYLIKGYAIHDKIKLERYQGLKNMVHLLGNAFKNQERLDPEQSKGLLAIITDYVYALDTLDKYDYQNLTIENTTSNDTFHATYENAMEAILSLKGKFGESKLFAHEKDQSFKSSIATIYQTFDGIGLYQVLKKKQQCYFI